MSEFSNAVAEPDEQAREPVPGLDEPVLEQCRRSFGGERVDRALELAADAWAVVQADFDGFLDDPGHGVLAGLQAMAIQLLSSLSGQADTGIAERTMIAVARAAAHREVSIEQIMASMRRTQAMWTASLLDDISTGLDPLADYRSAITKSAAVIDAVIGQFIVAYLEEQAKQAGSSQARLRGLVDILIADDRQADPGAVQRAAAELDLRPDDHHVAVVLLHDANQAGEIERRVRAVAGRVLRPVRDLTVHPDRRVSWIWLSSATRPSMNVMRSLVRDLAQSLDCPCAVGDLLKGVDGFRRTHLQAVDLAAFMSRTGRVSTLRWRDHSLVLLLARDMERAAWFVQATLGPLAEPSSRAAEFRETLSAYLSAGHSLKIAAAARDVHRNTIVYRLEQIEILLGRTIRDDVQALSAALLLSETFGPAVLYSDTRSVWESGPG